MDNNLINFNNYYRYSDMVKNQMQDYVINVPEDICSSNINDHIEGIYAILKDGVETDFVHNFKITVSWGGDLHCKLSIVDYWYNLFMWSMVLFTNQTIRPKHLFWSAELKRKDLKNYIDNFVLTKQNKINIDNYKLNIILLEGVWNYSKIEQFSYYLANTINNEDDLDLMNACPEFYDILHTSMQGVPFDRVKDYGMELTYKAMDIIKDSERYIGYEHSLANSFRASEAINPRQYKEVRINIGTKPNNNGTIYPYTIDTSFSSGGVNTPLYYFIESSTARTAQILSKNNVGSSGAFARLLGINNTDTILNPNPNYHCTTQHFIKYEIKTETHLSMIKNRNYRFSPNGMQYVIDYKDKSLIGKTIYLRSPMCCESLSRGKGICIDCYGELYWTNRYINVGKIAAEFLSSQLTQTLLSAKHLLETVIQSFNWNPEFTDYFDIDTNTIKISENIVDSELLNKFILVIDPDEDGQDGFTLVNEDDYVSYYDEDEESYVEEEDIYNEYITAFTIVTPDGQEIRFGSETQEPLYISNDLNTVIRKKAYNKDDKINVPLSALTDIVLFFVKINNNEISATMDHIKDVINKANITTKMTKDEALQSLVDYVVEGHLTIDAVHLEIILANQIVDANDILRKPNWASANPEYKLFTLNKALTNNPSIVVSLLYENINKVLYNPLSFNKKAPSFFDMFFQKQPQNYINDDLLAEDPDIKIQDTKILMCNTVDKPLCKVVEDKKDE